MALGSGRRSMKSPPLLIAVLLACVFVLGINYWITSTRCVDLQSRVMELESRIRRAAAERGAVEMKKNEFEDMLSKQKKQIDTIESLHNSKMQNVQKSCKSEMENLQYSLTLKEGLLQKHQAEMANVQKQLEDFKFGFEELKESHAKKLSFELAQCSNKIHEANLQCDEKIRSLKATDANAEDEEKDKSKPGKIKPVTSNQDINQKSLELKEQQKVVSSAVKPPKDPNTDGAPPLKNTVPEQTKKVNVVLDKKTPSPSPQQPKMQKDEQEQELHNEVKPNLANADEDDGEPKVEDVEDPNKEPENEEVERENLINMGDQPEDDKVAKEIQQGVEKPNDYNGDEANEAESETDKQVELRANNQEVEKV